MKNIIKLMIFGLLIWKKIISAEVTKPRIAIIGGGMGGATAAFFLNRLFKSNLEIDLFEPNKLGGRLAIIEINGRKYEAGGAVIHPQNKYMLNFVKLLGLKRKVASTNTVTGIWNGDEFVFTESKWKLFTIIKLLYRYGWYPVELDKYVTWILGNFEKIYKLQDNGVAFEDVPSFLSLMNPEFPTFLNISIKSHLENMKYSKNLIQEFVEGTLVVNYGQSINDVHAFVGYVSLAAVITGLWSVEGGNREVPEKLIMRNGSLKRIPSFVEKIRLIQKDRESSIFELTYRSGATFDSVKGLYDFVIIATPLTHDQNYPIEFEDFPEGTTFYSPGEYQTIVATFVEGNLETSYFKLDEEIDSIISCDPRKTIINCVGKITPVIYDEGKNQTKVWKLFTKERIKPDLIGKMFSQVKSFKEKIWKAYPKYSTEKRSDKFILFDRLYYVNAIEWAASAMEVIAIGGRNVALLAYRDYINNYSDSKMSQQFKQGRIEL